MKLSIIFRKNITFSVYIHFSLTHRMTKGSTRSQSALFESDELWNYSRGILLRKFSCGISNAWCSWILFTEQRFFKRVTFRYAKFGSPNQTYVRFIVTKRNKRLACYQSARIGNLQREKKKRFSNAWMRSWRISIVPISNLTMFIKLLTIFFNEFL